MPSEFATHVVLRSTPTARGEVIRGLAHTFRASRESAATLNLTISEVVIGSLPVPFYAAVEVRKPDGTWVSPRNDLFVFHDTEGDRNDETGTRTLTGVLWVADRASTHYIGPNITQDGGVTWVTASAGGVLADLLTRIPGHGITRTFTPAADSTGAAWPTADRTDQTAGELTSVASVLQQLTTGGYCDWYSQGTELVLLRAGTGTDRSSSITLGPGSTSFNVSESTAETASLFYVKSDQEGVPIQVVTRPELGAGPRQAVVTVAGATTKDAALRMAQPVIDRASQVRRQITITYDAAALPAFPFVDFNIGDDFTFTVGKYRLVEIQSTRGETTTVTLTFGEIILDLVARIVARVAQISLGSISLSAGSAAPIPPGVVLPAAEPAAPGPLTLAANAGGVHESGAPYAAVQITWPAVVTTVTGADTRVTEYEVWTRFGATPAVPVARTADPEFSADWDGPARTVTVRAFNGRWSEFSAPLEVLPAQPAQVVTAPSMPHLDAGGTTVAVSWDGTLASGDDMPEQFSELFAESAPELAGPWTRIGAPITRAGQVGTVRSEVGLPVFVRFAWVDTSGRVSDYSNVARADVIGITPDNLSSIEDFFANEAVITALRAGVLTAGAIEVDMLAPNVGELLNIVANEGLLILTGRVEATEEMALYYRFGPDGAVIGREEDPTKFRMTNTGASFEVNGVAATTWGPEGMDVPRLIADEATLANHRFEKSGDRTVVRWAGES